MSKIKLMQRLGDDAEGTEAASAILTSAALLASKLINTMRLAAGEGAAREHLDDVSRASVYLVETIAEELGIVEVEH